MIGITKSIIFGFKENAILGLVQGESKMEYKVFRLNKVVYITLAVLFIAAAWFLYSHFTSKKSFNVEESYIASKYPNSFASAIQSAAPAVVNIHTTKGAPKQQGLGSGIIIDSQGHVLTNYHVIESTQDITVSLPDGRNSVAKVIGTDPQTDLAVLKINLTELPVIKFGTSADLQVGDVVLAIGSPFGLRNTVTQGIVSALGTLQALPESTPEYSILAGDLIQTDATINLGNSGGALIDVNGHLVGVNTAILANVFSSSGIGFAIPVDTAKQVASEMIQHGTITRGWIGAQLTEISAETRAYLKYEATTGVYVQDTLRNSPAQIAGILPGDIITKINNVATQDINQTLRLISSLEPEKTYNLEVFREGELENFPVKVAIRQ